MSRRNDMESPRGLQVFEEGMDFHALRLPEISGLIEEKVRPVACYEAKDSSGSKKLFAGNYVLGKTLGNGSFGKVKLATHRQTGEKVAVKLVKKSELSKNKYKSKAISREIRLLKLLRHPNIIQLFEILEAEEYYMLIMEYSSGGELFDYIVARKRLNEKEAQRLFRQLIAALNYCHEKNVVHRDLKPENVLLDDKFNVKLIDFGLGNVYDDEELLGTFCGSPAYASPELINRKKYIGPRADVWSLGVLFYALVCGRLPFSGENLRALYQKVLAVKYELPSYLSSSCKQVIKSMLTFDPEKRATLREVGAMRWTMDGCTLHPFDENKAIPPYVEDHVVAHLICQGYSDEEIRQEVNDNTYSEICASYYLMEQKLRKQPKSITDKLKPKSGSLEREDSRTLKTSAPPTLGTIGENTAQPRMHIPEIPPFRGAGGPPATQTEVKASRVTSPAPALVPAADPNIQAYQRRGRRHSIAIPPATQTAARPSAAPSPVPQPVPEGPVSRPTAQQEAVMTPQQIAALATAAHEQRQKDEQQRIAEGGEPQAEEPVAAPTAKQVAQAKGRRRFSLDAAAAAMAAKFGKNKEKIEGNGDKISANEARVVNGIFSVSTTSSKTLEEVLAEVDRVMKEKQVQMKRKSVEGVVFSCKIKVNNAKIKFELEVCRLPRLDLFGLHLRRIKGNTWEYKMMCNDILKMFKL
eukprot:GCRY01003293.1.p1 GENE.GCRY01003293.1~~GCRY01003293.1.p1  ORF type:complete len:695 (-),score=200.40 GCRY01003293.1:1070-3154(-)